MVDFLVNFCPVPAPKEDKWKGVNEAEKKGVARAEKFTSNGSAYANMHGTRPGAIGLVLSSSPLALLAW
jgi:microsomal epoxide hydrolase